MNVENDLVESEDMFIEILNAVDRGEITASPALPKDMYCGSVKHILSNGYKVFVFNDCDEWDYIEAIETPDGKVIDFWTYLWDCMFPECSSKACVDGYGLCRDHFYLSRDEITTISEQSLLWKGNKNFELYERIRNWNPQNLANWPGWL
jgi:hypothetical protein